MAKIIKLSTQKISTQYGEKEKFLITVEQDGKQIVADSFCGKWNSDWQEGVELEIKPNQWKSRDYNGKKYWSIMAPPEAKSGFINPQEISELRKSVEGHENIINEMVRFIGKYKPILEKLSEKASSFEEEIPVVNSQQKDDEPEDDEIRLEDIPF